MSGSLWIAACFFLFCAPTTALATPQSENEQETPWLGEQGPSPADIAHHANALHDDRPPSREQAIAYLSTLGTQALPAIHTRVAALAQQTIERSDAISVLEQLLKEVSHDRLKDPPPLAQGARALLVRQRDRTTCAMVEATLLLQSLEGMRTIEAGLHMVEFFDVAEGAMGNELRRARARAGEWLLPSLIRLRSDDRKAVKRWAQAGVRELGLDDPKLATNLDDAQRVAEVVRAYSDPLDYDAMPTLVRLTRDTRLQVREAARTAVARFGHNAIWQLRQLYEELTSRRANASWSATRTAQELYAVIDRDRADRAKRALDAAKDAQQEGDLNAMQRQLGLALSAMPDLPQRDRVAESYAQAGAHAFTQQRYAEAERAYRTAVHLAKEQPKGERYRTELQFVRAEQALHHGIVDRIAYEQVLARDPNHAGAQDALDKISGRDAAHLQKRKKLAASVAGALMLLAAMLLAHHKWRNLATADT